MAPNINKPAPNFTLLATSGKTITLADLQGKNVILYFYPKDNTPGCTKQGECFRDQYPKFANLNAVILGISRDSLKSHENFKAKYSLPFELLADTDGTICELYTVIKDKNMYGKQVKGIERSTILIDKEGILRKEWRKLKIEGHIEEVLAALNTI